MVEDRPLLKTRSQLWLLTNMGNPWNIYNTRKEAIEEAKLATGKTWAEINSYFEVRKITLVEGWK